MSRAPESAIELRARALRLLARREHSRAELARKLASQTGSPEALARVLDSLEVKKQLSDERYAEERARQLARKYGAARIRNELRLKGVSEEILDRVYSDADDLAKAKAILERKYRGPAATPRERARRARFLQGRGFSVEIIRSLLSSRDTG